MLKRDKGSCLFFFLVGLALRGIPELLIAYYPVGYETITYYAPALMIFSKRSLVDVFLDAFRISPFFYVSHISSPVDVYRPLMVTFRAGPFFYVLMWLASVVSGAHAYLILKVVGPLLYGCLAVSFFVFVKRGLKLEWKMAFAATLILVFQVAALRESWDRFRNVLALVFLFATLTALKSDHKSKWPLVIILGVLTVLSREYIGFVLFVAVLGFAILGNRDRVISLIALAPVLLIFGVMVYPTLLWWSYFSSDNPFVSGNYLWMVLDVFSILAVCYLPLLLFVVKGFRRDKLLDPMFGWLLLGSFSVIVTPWLAVPGYQRWLMLLVFPFSVYAVKGFERFRLFDKSGSKKLMAIVFIFMVIGGGYSTGLFSYIGMLPNSYVAVSLVQSSIAWNQIDDVKDVLRWLDENAVSNSSVLTEERFYGWTLIYSARVSKDVRVFPYGAGSSPQLALERALDDGFNCIYLIWYNDSTLDNFTMIYSQERISVFQHEL